MYIYIYTMYIYIHTYMFIRVGVYGTFLIYTYYIYRER